MVRRLQQSEATAARVLDAAWGRFSTVPYESVRLSDIAADAEVSVQTLHTRFGTKEELFTTAFRRWMAEQGRRRERARVGDPTDIVRVLYDNYDDQGEIGLRMIAQEDRIAAIRHDTDAGRRWQRRWVGEMFAPFLARAASPKARADLHDALVVACDILTWRLLRLEMGHATADARRITVGVISALVAQG
jgi:AcrR family transcriptional regulator